jgi:broad specificity phosphatase PhoE
LIVALVLAVIGLAALVTAVVTSNELIAWVCIAASVIGVVLLIVDALRERSRGDTEGDAPAEDAAVDEEFDADYPEEPAADVDAETSAAPTESVDHDATEVIEEDRNPR